MNFDAIRALARGRADTGGGEPAAQERNFKVADLIRIVRFRYRLILSTAAAVALLAALVLFQITPLFTASALVMIDNRNYNVVDVEAVLSGLSTDPATMENQVQILTSRSLAGRIVDDLNLSADPEFNPALIPAGFLSYLDPRGWFGSGDAALSEAERAARERNVVVEILLSRLSVSLNGRSTAISLAVQSESAEKATRIANAYAEAYAEDQLNAKFEAAQRATRWLSERLDGLSQEVQTAEAAVAQYRADNDLIATSNSSSVIEQQLTELNAQLIIARSELAEQEAKYAQVVALQQSGRAADVNSVVDSVLIGQLREQETELLRREAELSSRYGPRHPLMVDLQSEKANLLAKIDEEVARVVQTTANEVEIARARVRSLQNSLGGLQSQTSTQNQARVQLSQLEAEAQTSRTLYDSFLTRFGETQGQEDIEAQDVRIVSRAEIPIRPSYPNKTLGISVALAGGLMLGFILAVLIEGMDSGFRTSVQVENQLGLPVLATIPEMKGLAKTGAAADRIVDKPMSAFAEAIRALKMGISLSNVDAPPRVVLVTSSVPGEGKTTTAVSLARLAAKWGEKVIVVDADLRRPAIASVLGESDVATGMIASLKGEIPLEKAIRKDPRSDAHFFLAEKNASSPVDLLRSTSMENLIQALRDRYDLVIIDSAPLLPVNDTRVIAHVADAILIVARWEKTPRDAVVSAIRTLGESKTPIAGVALTRADPERFRDYNYGQQNYYSYTKYYEN